MNKWKGKVAVVTGASGGIGAAITERLACEGLRVVLVARHEEQLQDLATRIRASGGEALVIVADLTNENDRQRILEQVRAAYGAVDVLVNNAGFGWYGFGDEMPWSLAWQMLQVNVAAVVQLTLLFLADMKARNGGHIVNIGSISGNLPSQGIALYGATKSFLDGFTTALYRELGGSNVHISLVRAGAVATGFFKKASDPAAGRRMPAERFGIRPERVANRIWKLLKRPARVVHVPWMLWIVPWVELCFGWLIDRLGPLLLKRQRQAS